MFYGAGKTVIFEQRAAATGEAKILWIQNSTITLAGEGDDVTAQGVPWTPGVLQDIASAQLSTTITGTMALQKSGLKDLEFILNTQAETASSFEIPVPFQTTISSNTATVSGLTVDQNVIVNVTTEGSQQFLSQIASAGTPAADEYDVTADTITFNASQFTDGTQVTGVYFETVSAGKLIGGNSTSTAYGNISFYGELLNTEYTNPVRFYIKQMSINTGFDLGLLGQAGDDIEVPVTLTTPTGWNRPYAFLFTS